MSTVRKTQASLKSGLSLYQKNRFHIFKKKIREPSLGDMKTKNANRNRDRGREIETDMREIEEIWTYTYMLCIGQKD